ncbi:MAG TPA: O-antigen ligase family protein [Acidobacteriota bacterium]
MNVRWTLLALGLALLPLGEGAMSNRATFLLQMVVILVAAARAWRRGLPNRWEPLAWLWLGLLAYQGFRAAASGALYTGLIVAADTLMLGLTAWAALELRARQAWLSALIPGAVIQAVLALGQLWTGRLPSFGRPTGTFQDPNHLAAYLGVAALVALNHEPSARRSSRWAWRVVAGVLVAAILATASRGAALALFLAALTVVRRPRRLVWAGAAAAALLTVVPNPLRARLFEARDPFAWSHPRLWGTAIRIGAEDPLFGCGPGLYEACGRRHNFPVEGSLARYGKNPNQAHNLALEVIAEQGLLGALLWLAAVGLLVRPAWRVAGPARAGLILLLLQAMVSNNLENRALAVLFVLLARIGAPRAAAPAAGALRCRPRALVAAVAAVLLYGVAWLPYQAEREELLARRRARREPERAAALVKRSLSKVPIDPSSWRLMAALEARRFQRHPEQLEALARAWLALDRAQRLAVHDPAILDDRIALLRLAASQGLITRELEESVRLDLQASIRLDPFNALRRMALAELERRSGRTEQVIASLRAALELEPRFLRARFELIERLTAAGRTAAARRQRAELERLLGQRPNWQPRSAYERELIRLPNP